MRFSGSSAILTVGTEITDGEVVDTNSRVLAEYSLKHGVSCKLMISVPDDRVAMLNALSNASSISDLKIVFVAGGLGPTSDDFTRSVVAEFLGEELTLSEESKAHVAERLRLRGSPVTPNQWAQCWFPASARRLLNPVGTAEGFEVQDPNTSVWYVVLPGPPSELRAVLRSAELKVFAESRASNAMRSNQSLDSHVFRIRTTGIGEGRLEDFVRSIAGGSADGFGYRAHLPFVDIKIPKTAVSVERVSEIRDQIGKKFGSEALVEFDGDRLVQDAFLNMIRNQNGLVKGTSPLWIRDCATGGSLQQRLISIAAGLTESISDPEQQVLVSGTDPMANLCFESWPVGFDPTALHPMAPDRKCLVIRRQRSGEREQLVIERTDAPESKSVIHQPLFFGESTSRRARLWAVEFALPFVASFLSTR